MIVRDIGLIIRGDQVELGADLYSKEDRNYQQRLWFRLPQQFASVLSADGDSFLAALLIASMVRGESLVIEAPVSAQLLFATEQIQDILVKWVKGAKRIKIEAPVKNLPAGPTQGAVAAFFSGGVDSFHSYLKNKALHQADGQRITHLILVNGFDIMINKKAGLYSEVSRRIGQLAKTEGRILVEVTTNIHEISDPVAEWGLYHGSAMAGVGLMLGPLFKEVIIPASVPYHQIMPWGTSPLLDSLWSNETTTFVHDGCEANRSEKIVDWICHSDLALQNLRVCWKNKGNSYNCGCCEKCLRTMISLYAGGGLARCSTFPQIIPLNLVKRMRLNKLCFLKFAEENLELLAKVQTKTGRDLFRSLKKAIRRGRIRIAIRVLQGRPV